MCFSPQRRAIFRHRNFKKWSEPDVFCTFSLENVLLSTATCWLAIFSTSELEKALWDPQFFNNLTSKRASRHSGVQFLISPLTTWLRTRRFNKPTFRLTRHTNHWKNSAFRDFSNIWRGWIFFLLTFALLHLHSLDFTSSHLLLICFSTLHIVGSLLFKLPSTNTYTTQTTLSHSTWMRLLHRAHWTCNFVCFVKLQNWGFQLALFTWSQSSGAKTADIPCKQEFRCKLTPTYGCILGRNLCWRTEDSCVHNDAVNKKALEQLTNFESYDCSIHTIDQHVLETDVARLKPEFLRWLLRRSECAAAMA